RTAQKRAETPAAVMDLTSTFAEEDHAHRVHQDHEIEENRAVLHVIEVVGQLLLGVFDRRAIGIIDLRPAGDARLYRMTLAMEGDRLGELVDEERTLWPRPDEAHIAAQHVEELRQLVDTEFTDDVADAGDAGIAIRGPADPVALGIVAHGAKFQNVEALTAETDALLAIERRAGAFEAHGDRRDRHHR